MSATSIIKSGVDSLETASANFALKHEKFFRPLSEFTESVPQGVARVVMYTAITFALLVFHFNYATSPDLAMATVEACVSIYVLGLAVMWLFMVGEVNGWHKNLSPIPAGPVSTPVTVAADSAPAKVSSISRFQKVGFSDSGFLGASEATAPAYGKVAA